MKKSKSRKRLRSSSRVSEDRISDLPDSIIQHILSFLDTSDAIKTCVLSKRWESLWTLVPNLIFRCEHGYAKEVYDRLACFVEKALMKHASPKIQKFLLESTVYYIPNGQFDSWLQYAVNHEVEELCLQLQHRSGGCSRDWPKCLYTNCFVTKMSLHSFFPKGGLEGFLWTSLKFLSLTSSNVYIDTLRSILEGSPLIECLTLQKCELYKYDGLHVFDASRSSLKQLVMDRMFDGCDLPIDISAPNLLSLNIVGFMKQRFNLVDVSSLVEANMDFSMGLLSYSREKKMLKDLIQDLGHVNKLKVGIWCIQNYSERKALHVKFPPATRKIVEVDIMSTMGYLPGLSALLYSLPDLEQLTINLMPSDYHEFKPVEFFVNNKCLRQPIRRCLIRHMKSVKITGFFPGSCSNSEKLVFELVQYLLDNANVLQELIIDAGVETSQSATPMTFRKLYEITQKLLSYPRASTDAVVMFGSHLQ